MFCSNCGKQLDSSAKFCPSCGMSNESKASLAIQPPTKLPFYKKRWFVWVALISVVLIISSFGESPEKKYTIAQKLTDEGKYKEALEKISNVNTDNATTLKNDLNMFVNHPSTLQKKVILSMTDEEIAATMEGTNTKQYLSHPQINKAILESIAKISNIAEVKEQAKKDAENERLKEVRENYAKNYISSWDGSNRGLEKYIKSHMNDPKSYEHVETKHAIDTEKGIATIRTRFRGRNSFGGMVVNSCFAKQDIYNGDFLEIKWE